MLRNLMVIAYLAMALTAAFGSPQDGLSNAIAAGINSPTMASAVFRFANGNPERLEKERFQSVCVGTFLSPLRAVTAAHCLTSAETSLTIACRNADGDFHVETLLIRSLAQHPTHDVSLLELERSPACDIVSVMIASRVHENDAFFAMKLPHATSSSGDNERRYKKYHLTETARSIHTFGVFDSDLCLSRGDSGTPLFIERNQPDGVIAGLLIAGTDDCRGEQTFVRLDRIREWIQDSMQQAKGH